MKFFSLLFCVLIYSISFSQGLESAWQRAYGGSGGDILEAMLLTSDGGFLLGGRSNSDISYEKADSSKGSNDFWIIKLNEERDTVWQKTYGGEQTDELIDMTTCADGGYLLAGSSASGISMDKSEESYGLKDFWVIRIDSIGTIIWDKTIGGAGDDVLIGIIDLEEDGFILGGNSKSDSSGLKTEDAEGNKDFWVVKIDTLGDIVWQNTIGGNALDVLYSINPTNDNGILLGGHTLSGISGDKLTPLTGLMDFWMVKLNEFGEYVWDRSVGGDNQSGLGHAIQVESGDYIIAGPSNCDIYGIKTEPQYQVSIWAVAYNEAGDLIWENTIAGDKIDYLTDIIPTSDGGSMIVGYSNSDISYDKTEESKTDNLWIIKLSDAGIVEWENTVVTQTEGEPTTIIKINDGEYLVGGYCSGNYSYEKHTNSRGGKDFWIINFQLCPTIDISVTPIDVLGYIYALESNAEGVEYQWYFCDDVQARGILPGETNKIYYADTDYSYYNFSVSTIYDECVFFSDCNYAVNIASINENELNNAILIYPNPAKETIQIDSFNTFNVKIKNEMGEIVLTTNKTLINVADLARGFYTVYIYDDDKVLVSVNKVVLN